jgi:hypothetical protein
MSECRIPHIVHSIGISIHSDCAKKVLTVTPDHLVFTQNGLVMASQISVGDTLFRDVERTQRCTVKAVQQEPVGQYFGLNCRESVVLADGVASSTFGRYHAIGAVWMRTMSGVVGVARASEIGDVIVQFLSYYNCI